MSIHIPQVGLSRMLNEIVADTLTLRLFTNNLTLAPTSVAASFVEAVGGGYAAVSLTAGWTLTAGNPATTSYNSEIIFTFTGSLTGPGTIFGYYITRFSGEVVWAEYLQRTRVPQIPASGSFLKITPKIGLDNS